MAELESGQTLAARFTLIRHLGRGGMGDVWLSRDEHLGATVVTKIVPPDATPEQISLLRQECRNARRLSHPNIVRVYDFHEDSAAVFISMEYVEGGDISQLRGRDARTIFETVIPLVRALEYAHGEGVIHRDLKSSNVLLDASGRACLSDFGIAGVLAPGPEDLRLAGGGSGGSASPQQRGGMPASPADDIYGLGALLTDLLATTEPSDGRLEPLLQSMMAEEVAARPPDMKAVRQALEELSEDEVDEVTMAPRVIQSDIRLSPPPRVTGFRAAEAGDVTAPTRREAGVVHRHPGWWLTVLAFVVLIGVAFGVFVLLPAWVENRPSTRQVPGEDRPASPTAAAVEPAMSTEELAAEPGGSVAADTAIAGETDSGSSARVEQAVDEAPERPASPSPPRRSQTTQRQPEPGRADTRNTGFTAAMSEGLQAFERQEYESAKRAFERALTVSPQSAEAADGLARVELALRMAAIRRHQSEAEAFERQERWRQAEGAYAAALALDSTLRFASEGRDRAAARAVLDDRLEYHLAHSERLSSQSVLEEARDTLGTAQAIEPPTEKLQRQIDQLQEVMRVATTPVPVVLISDNQTQVVVYKVGRLGTFESRTLDLRPGTYTVVGTREGYRDVRRQLKVVADGENEPLTVRCEEPI